MLPGGSDAIYRTVLSGPHRHYVNVQVWSGQGQLLREDLPFQRGNVSATLTSRVSRNLDIEVHADFYPAETSDLLAPFGNEIRAFRGVQLGDGSLPYVWQVFRGRIQQVSVSSDGTCRVRCSDRATDVIDHAFVTPQNSQPSNTVYSEFIRLITDALPDAEFGVSDEFQTPVRPLTWQQDRGSALDELATSVGAYWYPLANGAFVLRRYPWTVNAPAVTTLTDQEGGTVNGWDVERSRQDVYNIITVTGERLNGDTPVHAVASDTTVTSPTYIEGGFGVKSLLKRLQTPGTEGAAQAAANAALQDAIAPAESWSLEVVPDAALELGDVVQVKVNNRDVRQVVSGFTLPLDLYGNMMISTRSLVLNTLEVA